MVRHCSQCGSVHHDVRYHLAKAKKAAARRRNPEFFAAGGIVHPMRKEYSDKHPGSWGGAYDPAKAKGDKPKAPVKRARPPKVGTAEERKAQAAALKLIRRQYFSKKPLTLAERVDGRQALGPLGQREFDRYAYGKYKARIDAVEQARDRAEKAAKQAKVMVQRQAVAEQPTQRQVDFLNSLLVRTRRKHSFSAFTGGGEAMYQRLRRDAQEVHTKKEMSALINRALGVLDEAND